MQNDKLLPCPFCGEKAEIDIILDVDERWLVRCPRCFCKTTTFGTRKSAIITWNTRKPMQLIVEKLEKEKEYYKKIYEGLPKGNVISERAQAVVETCEGCIEDIKRWCR